MKVKLLLILLTLAFSLPAWGAAREVRPELVALFHGHIDELADLDDDLCAANEILKKTGGNIWACLPDSGGGSSIILDLGDDDVNESVGLLEIAIIGDTNSIFTESAADKLLIDAGKNWPTSDSSEMLSDTSLARVDWDSVWGWFLDVDRDGVKDVDPPTDTADVEHALYDFDYDVIYVRDFSADKTITGAEIQKAIIYAESTGDGGIVQLPCQGVAMLADSTITITERVWLRGCGQVKSILQNSPSFLVSEANPLILYLADQGRISDLTLQFTTDQIHTGPLIYAKAARQLHISDVYLHGLNVSQTDGAIGLLCEDSLSMHVQDTWINGLGRGISLERLAAGNSCNAFHLDNSYLAGNKEALVIDTFGATVGRIGCENMTVTGGVIEGTTSAQKGIVHRDSAVNTRGCSINLNGTYLEPGGSIGVEFEGHGGSLSSHGANWIGGLPLSWVKIAANNENNHLMSGNKFVSNASVASFDHAGSGRLVIIQPIVNLDNDNPLTTTGGGQVTFGDQFLSADCTLEPLSTDWGLIGDGQFCTEPDGDVYVCNADADGFCDQAGGDSLELLAKSADLHADAHTIASHSDTIVDANIAVGAAIQGAKLNVATESVRGVLQIATQSETDLVLADNVWITPLKLGNFALAGGDLGGDLDTPTVTAVQNGAVAQIADLATGIKTGDDGEIVTGTAGGTGFCAEWNVDGDLVEAASAAACGSGGSVATDAIWDAKGDLAAGTGANTAARLGVGANDTMLMADTTPSQGMKWATSATVRTALGLVIGTNVEAWDTELDLLAGLAETTGNVIIGVAGEWASVAQPIIDCTNCTAIPAGSHAGTIDWTGTSIIDHGALHTYGISDETTITHIWDLTGTFDPQLAATSGIFTFSDGATTEIDFIVEGAVASQDGGGVVEAISIDGGSGIITVSTNIVTIDCVGPETIATILGGVTGQLLTLINIDSGIQCTFVDDDEPTAANAINLDLALVNWQQNPNDILTLAFDGNAWREVSRNNATGDNALVHSGAANDMTVSMCEGTDNCSTFNWTILATGDATFKSVVRADEFGLFVGSGASMNYGVIGTPPTFHQFETDGGFFIIDTHIEMQQEADGGTPTTDWGNVWVKDTVPNTLWFTDDLDADFQLGLGSNHAILSTTHTDTLAATVVDGDLMIGNVTPAWSRLAGGTADNYLSMGALRPEWIGLNLLDADNQGAVTTVLHGNAGGAVSFGSVVAADLSGAFVDAASDFATGVVDSVAIAADTIVAGDVDASLDTRSTQFTIIEPDPAGTNRVIHLPPVTGTMTRIDCEVFGGTNVVINICDGEDYLDDTCAVSIFDATASTTLTCVDGGANDTALNATGYVARDKVSLILVSESGTVDQLTVYITSTVD